MGIVTDFFVASEGELRAAFPNWHEVTGNRIKREFLNPFTGAMQEYSDWERGAVVASLTSTTSVSSRDKRFEWKNLDPVKLASLQGILLGTENGAIEELLTPALLAPEDLELQLYRMPTKFINALAEAKDTTRIAKLWAATEEFELDGWSTEDAMKILAGLNKLAKLALENSQGMFHEIHA